MARFILSGFGLDRPGIVAQVSKLLLDLGANLEDTAMTRLNGQFAMLVMFSDGTQPLTQTTVETAMTQIVPAVGLPPLHLFVSEVDEHALLLQADPPERYLIRVSGADRPGIVYSVTRHLAELGVNIVDLSSRRLCGSERAIYLLLLEVTLPPNLTGSQLESTVRQLQAQLGLEIQVEPVEVMTL
jgi:glycine cleavage system transcriptional repressor